MKIHLEFHGASATLWTENTPTLNNQKTATLGDLTLPDHPDSITFLKSCIQHAKTHTDAHHLLAPMNQNTWQNHRLTETTDHSPPFLLEPTTPPHYLPALQAAGFKILSRYNSSRIDLTQATPPSKKLQSRLTKNQIHIRPINPENFETELKKIYNLSLTAFQNNFLYTPIDQTTFIEMYQKIKPHTDPNYILLAEKNNQLIGYIFALKDPTNPNPTLIIKTLAVSPEHRTNGLGNHLVAQVQQTALKNNIQTAIHALKHETNQSQKISNRHNSTQIRQYALLSTHL